MGDEIEITFLEDDDLPQHPLSHSKDSFKEWYSPKSANVRVTCSRSVFEVVEQFSKENNKKEVGGVLLGKAYRHDGDIYVEITECIKAQAFLDGQSGLSHFTFTEQTWAEILRIKDTQYENLIIVGWFHSHPGHRVFLSPMDVSIHNGHFNSPWHVAMVYDPIHHEGGFFVWESGKIIPAPGFYELFNPGQKKGTLTWKKPSHPVPQFRTTPESSNWWNDPWVGVMVLVLLIVLISYATIDIIRGIESDSKIIALQETLASEQAYGLMQQLTLEGIIEGLPTATPINTMDWTLSETPIISITPTR